MKKLNDKFMRGYSKVLKWGICPSAVILSIVCICLGEIDFMFGFVCISAMISCTLAICLILKKREFQKIALEALKTAKDAVDKAIKSKNETIRAYELADLYKNEAEVYERMVDDFLGLSDDEAKEEGEGK